MIAVFILATLLPYGIAARVARSGGGRAASPDHQRFEVLVLATGGLYAVLHVLAFAGLLSIPAAGACVGLAALAAFAVTRHRPAALPATRAEGAANPQDAGGADRWMERVSIVVVAFACACWLVRSAAGLDVIGTDAAHYHIPHAVNYALGASPWGPMPTAHGYPMGTSLLFAWFILPFGDAFVVDASMVAWYLLLVASLAALFNTLTGLRGWMWTPWLAFVLFGLPLIRASASPSADLPYAASFLAVAAQLAWMISRREGALRDWAVLGGALGMLVGSKALGIYSAAILAAAAGAGYLAARKREAGSGSQARPWTAASAVLAAALLTGGIWIVRNTVLSGWPVDLQADRYHLSILQDVRTVYGGDWCYLAWRAGIKIGRWLGPSFLAAGVAIVWLAFESASRMAGRRSDAMDGTRLWFLGLSAAVAAVHVAGLVGAPWTSLEWTDGHSLRYVLPFWILYALLAFAGTFSRLIPWHRHAAVRAAVWLLMVGAVMRGALRSPEPAGLSVTGLSWPAVLGVAAALLAFAAAVASPARRFHPRPRAALLVAGMAVSIGAAVLASTAFASRHDSLREAAIRKESAELASWTAAGRPASEPHRQVYLEVRADELRQGRACAGRRFFVASRFDLPLELQPAAFTSQVFDSRRAGLALPLLRRAPDLGWCDYAVADPQETGRPAMRLALPWLRPIPSSGPFLIFEITRSS